MAILAVIIFYILWRKKVLRFRDIIKWMLIIFAIYIIISLFILR